MIPFFAVLIAALVCAGPAHAGFLVPIVAGFFGGGAIATAAASILVGVGSSLVSRALQPKQKAQGPGAISIDAPTSGDGTPQSIILGGRAVAGHRTCPEYSRGNGREWLTIVRDLSDMPINGLISVWFGNDRMAVQGTQGAGGDVLVPRTTGADSGWFTPSGGKYAGKLRVRFYDGTQTAADPHLLAEYGSHPDRPWQADMRLLGVAYVIIELKRDQEVFPGIPDLLFEVEGAKLYDPRNGQMVWSNNLALIAYNVMRGIQLPDGSIYGGGLDEADLPLSSWGPAINEAGAQNWRGGLEVSVGPQDYDGDMPYEVIEHLLQGCAGQVAESGGVWRVRIGGPGLPVASATDRDVVISENQVFMPHQGPREVYNGVTGQYSETAERWESKTTPLRIDPAYVARDGARNVVHLTYHAVTDSEQCQKLIQMALDDNRRQRTHELSLPLDYAPVEVLDTLSLALPYDGYVGKLVEVTAKTTDPVTMGQRVFVREVDPNDYTPPAVTPLPTVPVVTTPLAPQPLPGWAVEPVIVQDAEGRNRRPGARIIWTPLPAEGIEWELRSQGATELAGEGTTQEVEKGQRVITAGLINGTAMQIRGRAVLRNRARAWTAWTNFIAPDIGLNWVDFDQQLREDIEADLALIPAAQEAAEDARARADAVRSDHDALVEGFVGKLTDLSAADQGIQQRIDLVELSISNSSYIRKTDGDGPSIGLWDGIGAAADPVSSTSVPPGQTGRSIEVSAPGAFEAPTYTGASLNGTIFRIRGWVFVSAGATARAAIVSDTGATLAQGAAITGGWQQIDQQFTVGVETGAWAPAFLVTAGGTMRFWRVRLEDYSAAASLEASIAQNAQAIIDENTARVASVGTLTARANSLAGRIFPSDMRNNAEFWTHNLGGSPETVGGMAAGVTFGTHTAAGAYVRIPAAHSGNVHVVSKATTEFTPGKKIRLTVRLRTIGGATTKLRALFVALRSDWSNSRSLNTGASVATTAGDTWQTVTLDYTLPAALSDEVWLRVGVFSNATSTPDRVIDIASIRIDDITASEAVRGELTGEITSIKGLDLNALDGTAFGVLLDQLQVNAGGTSAAITAQGSAIADLEGNASAGYLLRAQAGGAVSLLDLIAADGSGQTPTSIARLAADQILLEGSVFADQLAVVGVPTLVHDPLYKRLGSWVGLANATLALEPAASAGGGVAAWGGETILRLLPTSAGAYARVLSRKVRCAPGQRVKVEVPAWASSAGRTASVRLFFYATEAQAGSSATNIATSNTVGTTRGTARIETEVPAGCAWMSLELASPAGTTTAQAWFGYPELRIMDAANLVVAGGAVAEWFSANTIRAMLGQFSSLQAANITVGNGEVGTLKIAGNAVTVPAAQQLASILPGNGTWRNANTISYTLPFPGSAAISWFGSQGYVVRQSQAIGIRLRINGVLQWQRIAGDPNGGFTIEQDWLAMGWRRDLPAGTHSIQVDWWSNNANLQLEDRTLIVQGAMR